MLFLFLETIYSFSIGHDFSCQSFPTYAIEFMVTQIICVLISANFLKIYCTISLFYQIIKHFANYLKLILL